MQKTNFKTRLLALLTAVFMVIMCVPFAAFADGGVNVKFKGDTNSDDWNKVYAEKTFAVATDEIEAPKLPEGYDYWKSNNGTKDLKAGDKLTYADVKDAANGTVNYTPVKDQTPKTQTIYVSYIEEGNPSNVVGREEFQLDKSATNFNASVLQKVPEGWELARTGDISLGGSDSVNVEVRKIVTTQTIYVSYIEEGNPGNVVGREEFQLDKSATYFNASVLQKVPEGWELARTGDISLGGSDSVNVEVRKIVTTQTIYVSYIEEGNPGNVVGREEFQLDKSATYFNASVLQKVPEGWELARTGDISLGGSDCVNVEVRKVPTTKTIKINYYSEAEEKQIAEVEMTVGINDTYINTSKLTAPEGYKLVLSGDLAIRDGYVYAAVNKIGSKTVKINYYSEAEEKQIAEVEMTVAPDATCVNTSKLTAPTGYELVEVGDLPIRDGYVYAAVRKVSTKEVKINFYCPEEKKQVAEPTVVVNADATCVNSSAYAALVPAGYELAEVGDMPIRDGYVYAEVRKVATKTIKINYYSEAEEKQIAEVEMTVPADATYVNTSKLTAPAGYELVLAGDLPIRDGYVYAAVRKVPTTTIKISYVDEATDKEVGTEDLVVNQGTTVVNFNVLKSVPAGYELCEVGDFYVGNGSAKVMVRKTKSNNGSSSSTSSSSSNKTTTASSKAEQKVVKAAAAPANTTKVLPKTGASNVAPLLGGSLAVVALLMGYGVYGLVLRKKD